MRPLRIVELGVDHPHGEMYRTTLAHHPGYELVGAYDPDPARAMAMLAREGRDVPVAADMHDILSSRVADAALITLPNDVTPDAIAASARSSLHVFAEKPSATTAAAFRPACEAVEEAGIQFLSGYLRRFSPAALTLRDIVAEGILGELVATQITFLTTTAELRNATYLSGNSIESVASTGSPPESNQPAGLRHWLFERERSGGGIMHWLGVHWIDLLRFVAHDEFTHVTASLMTRAPAPIDVEDVASVTLESSSGIQATVACAYVLPRGPDQIHFAIQGTLGSVLWNGVGPELHVRTSHSSWRSSPVRSFRFEADDIPGYAGVLGWEAFEQFRGAILGQNDLPMSVVDSLKILEVLDAIQISGAARQRVAV